MNVAIDGPAGAGKSSVARAAAKALGWLYVDTGALYRAVGLYVHRKGRDTADPAAVLPLLPEIALELRFESGEQRVCLNGEDVSDAIRAPEMGMAASNVSAIPGVRDFLFDRQRELAARNDVLMDGRDIGTVVLPGAELKIFLTASPEERARRRVEQLRAKGRAAEYGEILAEVRQRDYNDSHRAVAPLRQAEDAKLLDSTGLSEEETVRQVLEWVKERRERACF